MAEYLPPSQFVPIFDILNYSYQEQNITYAQLAKYLPLVGGTITGNLFINGILSIQPSQLIIGSTTVTADATQLNYVNVTPGTAAATSALIVDSGRNIININNIGVNMLSIGAAVLTATELGYISGVIPGTATASQALILDASRNITNINNLTFGGSLSGPIINSNTYLLGGSSILASALTSITPGTVAASKAIVVDTNRNITNMGTISQTVAAGADMITLTSTLNTTRNTIKFVTDISNMEFGSRSGSAGSFPNSMYMYTNGSYKWIMNANSGDTQILSTTDTTAINTGCLQLSGGLSVVKNVYTTGQVTVDRSGGSNFNLRNGANFAFLEVAGTNMLRLVAGTGGSMAMNLDSNGLYIGGGTSSARAIIDMGATATNKGLSLFNNTSSYYGISPNNSSLQLSSGGSAGFQFYASCTDASPINTNVMTIGNTGLLTLTNTLVASKGTWVQRTSFSSSGRSGRGITSHFSDSNIYGEIFAYNYGSSTKDDLILGNTIYIGAQNGFVGIGLNNTTNPSYPLTISGNFATSYGGSYGYLSTSVGSGVGTGVVNVGLFVQHRIWCNAEINCFSDLRAKENIKNINKDDAIDFVRNVKAKHFTWKTDTSSSRCVGYLAQDLAKNGKFPELVCIGPDDQMEELIDEDNFVSPKGQRFLVSYMNTIPVIHSALASLYDVVDEQKKLIEKQEKQIDFLETRLNETVKSANAAHNEIIDLNERLNDVVEYINKM